MHTSCTCMTWLIHMCNVTWLIRVCFGRRVQIPGKRARSAPWRQRRAVAALLWFGWCSWVGRWLGGASRVTHECVVSRMHELCHVSVSHITYEWGMSRMNEACHVWMKHVTYEWDMSHMNETCHVWMRHVTYEWGMSRVNETCHIWTRHVTYVRCFGLDDFCYGLLALTCASCHIWMFCDTYEWVMSHMMLISGQIAQTCASMATSLIMLHVDESCDVGAHEQWCLWSAQARRWMSHVTYEWGISYMHESCHIWMSHVTYEWVMSHMNESCHIWMSHVTYEW